jgi:hypothetical protein
LRGQARALLSLCGDLPLAAVGVPLGTADASRQDATAFVRLNIASDLDLSHIAEQFPSIRFYDYTKVRSRVERQLYGDFTVHVIPNSEFPEAKGGFRELAEFFRRKMKLGLPP